MLIPCFVISAASYLFIYYFAYEWVEQGFSFGFVEFEVASAVQSALEVFIRSTLYSRIPYVVLICIVIFI